MTPAEEQRLRDQADASFTDAANTSFIPIIGSGMASGSVGRGRQALGQISEGLISDVGLPEFSDQDYGGYSLAGTYDPQLAGYQTVQEDPRTREIEMAALERLVANNGAAADAGRTARSAQALNEGNQLAKSREDAVRMRMDRMGQGGSGLDAVLQAQGAQMGANRAAQGTLDATHQAALEKLANEQAILGGAGNVRGQDYTAAKNNADIINQFGMFNTGLTNEARRMNLNAAQNISNANVDAGNKSLDRRDRNKQTSFGNAMGKASSRGNALMGMGNAASQAQQAGAQAQNQGWNQGKDVLSAAFGLFSDEE